MNLRADGGDVAGDECEFVAKVPDAQSFQATQAVGGSLVPLPASVSRTRLRPGACKINRCASEPIKYQVDQEDSRGEQSKSGTNNKPGVLI